MTGCRDLLSHRSSVRVLRAFTFLVAIVISAVLTDASAEAAPSSRPLHIMIDPGHGGIDTGAARGHLEESKIALKVAKRLASLMKDDSRFKVSMTRTKDVSVSLERRTEMADKEKVDLFISIHLNSSHDPRARGKEIYFQNQLPVDEEAMFLASRENELAAASHESQTTAAKNPAAAQNVRADASSEHLSANTDLQRILEDLRRSDRIYTASELSQTLLQTWTSLGGRSGSRAIRQAPFHVVSNVSMPSILVELGFLSHPREGPLLAQDDYQDKLATSLYKGLVKFKETLDKDRARNLNSAHAN